MSTQFLILERFEFDGPKHIQKIYFCTKVGKKFRGRLLSKLETDFMGVNQGITWNSESFPKAVSDKKWRRVCIKWIKKASTKLDKKIQSYEIKAHSSMDGLPTPEQWCIDNFYPPT